MSTPAPFAYVVDASLSVPSAPRAAMTLVALSARALRSSTCLPSSWSSWSRSSGAYSDIPGFVSATRSITAFFERSSSGRRLRSTAASAWSASSSAWARRSRSSRSSSSALSTAASVPSQPYANASLRRRSNDASSLSMRVEKRLALAAVTRPMSALRAARSAMP